MKIVFIGTVQFSHDALEKLIELNANIVGVCTKERSKFNADYSELAPLCEKRGIPYRFVDDINSPGAIEWISSLAPDIIFCFGWSSLIKRELLNLAPMGILGFHPAALPQNRGRHPLIWAIALGLKESASSFFFMGEGADDGDILSQEFFAISSGDDAAKVYEKVTGVALGQIEKFLPLLETGKYPRQKQDHSKANVWRKRKKNDGKIDFRMTSKGIYDLVRALTSPYVGAHVEYGEDEIKVWETKPVDCTDNNIEPGKVLDVSGDVIKVKTWDSAILLLRHDFSTLPLAGDYL